MNHARRFSILTLAGALLLGACSSQPSSTPPLEGARIGGPFTLTDQDGRKVSDRSLAGKYRLIYFGYTFCPDVCPVDMQVLGQGLRTFETDDPARAARVQPIFITVDPERDTPAVLKQFVGNFHPRFIGLTGTRAEIDAVAKRFTIYSARQGKPGARDYLVDHSRMALLFGPKGEPIAIVPHDQGASAVAAELERWVS
jgi:protein SCO1/2